MTPTIAAAPTVSTVTATAQRRSGHMTPTIRDRQLRPVLPDRRSTKGGAHDPDDPAMAQGAIETMRSGSRESIFPGPQRWIDYFSFQSSGSEPHEDYENSSFWEAHQYSLYYGVDLAEFTGAYGAESALEREFIDVSVGNVQYSADILMSPSMIGGHAVGYFINNIAGYWDTYPAPYPSKVKEADEPWKVAGLFYCPPPSNAPRRECE